MYRKLIFTYFHIPLSIYDFWVEEGEVFQIPSAKSIWIIFFKHTWWRANLCKVVYRKGRLLLLLGHGSFSSTTVRRKSLAIIYCIGYDTGAGPGLILPAWDVSPVVLWHFPTGKYSIKTISDRNLFCPHNSQKIPHHLPPQPIPVLGPLCFSCPISWISDVNLLCLILYTVSLEKNCPQRKSKGQKM